MPMKPMVPLLLTVLASAGQNQYLPPTFFTNAIPIKIQITDGGPGGPTFIWDLTPKMAS
jgi:hypothetical protein